MRARVTTTPSKPRVAILIATTALCAGLPVAARAGQTVTLKTSFNPDRLGARTTIEFGFQAHSTIPQRAPEPVTDVDLHLPAGLGLATSTLGLANCDPAALLAGGVDGCPANARIGFGSALVTVPAESGPVEEEGSLTALVGPPNNEHLEILFYAEGHSPVFAQLVFPGQVLDDNPPFSGRLDTAIPLIPTWPGGPDVAVTRMTSTIGPRGLTYYRHAHGKIVPFHPRGIAVPERCPRRGFPFRVDIAFLDGTHQTATSTVPCPR
ncbi:MAG TPA: hypothetical protein VG053_07310 [Solirubrobacteraceae bacterium]|jgi:hypothetical protein|nr:hypothetical protein [Solirubrobacteraceae bacterium]